VRGTPYYQRCVKEILHLQIHLDLLAGVDAFEQAAVGCRAILRTRRLRPVRGGNVVQRRRLRVFVVRHEIAAEGLLEDALPQPLGAVVLPLGGGRRVVGDGQQALDLIDDLFLLGEWRNRKPKSGLSLLLWWPDSTT